MSIFRKHFPWDSVHTIYPLAVAKVRERYGHAFGLIVMRDLYDRFDELGVRVGVVYMPNKGQEHFSWQVFPLNAPHLYTFHYEADRHEAEVKAFTTAFQLLNLQLATDELKPNSAATPESL